MGLKARRHGLAQQLNAPAASLPPPIITEEQIEAIFAAIRRALIAID